MSKAFEIKTRAGRRFTRIFIVFVGMVLLGDELQAKSVRPIVVELFTSQSCYSCPPAELFLGELSKSNSLVTLEFHVDYWNNLIHGSSGKWRDKFSSPEASQRQRNYNKNIRGSPRVYTPQMVIDGTTEIIGINTKGVRSIIGRARLKKTPYIEMIISGKKRNKFSFSAFGPEIEPTTIWFIRYIKSHTTDVLAGENKGKKLTNYNIVQEVRRLSDWAGERMSLEISVNQIDDNQGCVIIVQNENLGPILGAALCPETQS